MKIFGLVLVFLFSLVFPQLAFAGGTITLNPNQTFQTIVGWEAVNQVGGNPVSYLNDLMNKSVNDLGLSRMRMEVKPVSGNSSLDWNLLDTNTGYSAVTFRNAVLARGEKPFMTLTAVKGAELQRNYNPPRFGSEIVRMFDNMKNKYGFVPDAIEILEPSLFGWPPNESSAALYDAAIKLQAAGYTPYIVAPSSECGAQTAIDYWNNMKSFTPALVPFVKEFSYHNYCYPSDAQLQAVANVGNSLGIKTAMLEHGSGDYNELHRDLKLANVSAWEQFTLAYPTVDDGYQYYLPSGSTVTMGSRTPYLRQYFKYIRPGAVRIAAQSSDVNQADPVAFINSPNNPIYPGAWVVVVRNLSAGPISVVGLPAGSYGVTCVGVNCPLENTLSITSGQTLITPSMPVSSAVTIYQKTSGGGTPTPTISPTPTLTPIPTPTSAPNPIKDGNANGIGGVDAADLTTILANYIKSVTNLLDQYPDNKVNAFDFVVVLKRLP